MLGDRRADQAPDRRGGEVGGLALGGGDRLVGEDGEARALGALLLCPVLEQGEDPLGACLGCLGDLSLGGDDLLDCLLWRFSGGFDRRRRWSGHSLPLDPVQGTAQLGGSQLPELERAGRDRADGEDGRAGLIEGGDAVLALGGQAQAERRGVLSIEADLGVGLLAIAPGRAQSLELRAVIEPVLGEALVDFVELDWLGALGGPGVERLRSGCGLLADDAARVWDPLLLAVLARVDRDLTAFVLIWA